MIGCLLDQTTGESRLARSNLSSQQNKATTAPDAVEQMRQCFLMMPSQKKKTRIGRNGKGRLMKSKKRLIHYSE